MRKHVFVGVGAESEKPFVFVFLSAVWLLPLTRHRRQSDFEDVALEWLDAQHRDEVQQNLAQM